MVAQTLANPQVDRPLVLNGHLVRLGLADDIVHESGSVELELGFELRPPADVSSPGARKARDVDSQKLDASFIRSSDNDFEIDTMNRLHWWSGPCPEFVYIGGHDDPVPV